VQHPARVSVLGFISNGSSRSGGAAGGGVWKQRMSGHEKQKGTLLWLSERLRRSCQGGPPIGDRFDAELAFCTTHGRHP
jgi:hypothetical protein